MVDLGTEWRPPIAPTYLSSAPEPVTGSCGELGSFPRGEKSEEYLRSNDSWACQSLAFQHPRISAWCEGPGSSCPHKARAWAEWPIVLRWGKGLSRACRGFLQSASSRRRISLFFYPKLRVRNTFSIPHLWDSPFIWKKGNCTAKGLYQPEKGGSGWNIRACAQCNNLPEETDEHLTDQRKYLKRSEYSTLTYTTLKIRFFWTK